MSVSIYLRRIGDVLVLTGLGFCSAAIIMMVALPSYAQQAKKEILREQVNPKTGDSLDPWFGGNWQFGAFGSVSNNPYRGTDSVDMGLLPLVAYDAERMHIGIDGVGEQSCGTNRNGAEESGREGRREGRRE